MDLPYHLQEHNIVSVTLRDGFLEVVRKYPSNSSYGSGQPVPDRVVKEIYASAEQIVLDRVVEGKHTPASWNKEKIEFLDE
jgi:hypothetical protein